MVIALCLVSIGAARVAGQTNPTTGQTAAQAAQAAAQAVASTKQSATPTGNSPATFRTLTIDLTTGTVNDVLPFYEPFVVKLTGLPPEITGAQLRFLATDFKRRAPPCIDKEWSSSEPWRKSTSASTTAVLVMGPLAPDNYYHACVLEERPPSATEVKAAIPALVRELDLATRQLNETFAGGLPAGATKQIQLAMLMAIRSVPGVDSIRVVPGSILDTAWRGNSARLARVRGVAALRQAASRHARDAANVEHEAQAAGTTVNALSDSASALAVTLAEAKTRAPFVAPIAALSRDRALRATLHKIAAIDVADVDDDWPSALSAEVFAEQWSPTQLSATLDSLGSRIPLINDQVTALAKIRDSLPVSARPRLDAIIAMVKRTASQYQATATNMATMRDGLATRNSVLQSVGESLQAVEPIQESVFLIFGSSVADLVSRARQRVALDLGLVGARGIARAAPYAGVSIYPVPVNKDVPLKMQPGWFFKRVSVGLGLTLSPIGAVNREDLIGGHSLIFDVGVRPWDAFRISAGCLVFRRIDNPLTPTSRTVYEPTVGVAIDNAIKSVFGQVGDWLFPPPKPPGT